MQKYGYTGSACIPMALDDAIELGKIKRGDLVVMIQWDSDGTKPQRRSA
jgi:3-oxoacyl-[acyl-carrier-protein] synthase-3